MNAEDEKQQFIEYINESIKDIDADYSNWCVGIGDPITASMNLKRYYPLVSVIISDLLSTEELAEQMRGKFKEKGCTNHPEFDDSLSCLVYLIYKFPPLSLGHS